MRLEKLIENTKKGIMYGDWNDNGRLLNYQAKILRYIDN